MIAHMSLMSSMLPPNVIQFLREILSIMRLDFSD